MSMWRNSLAGCLVCIICGAPYSQSCQFNPSKSYIFLIFYSHAMYFLNDVATFLNWHGDSLLGLPLPWNLGANLIIPYQYKTMLFFNKRANQDYSMLHCNPKLDIYFWSLPGTQVHTRLMLFCWWLTIPSSICCLFSFCSGWLGWIWVRQIRIRCHIWNKLIYQI